VSKRAIFGRSKAVERKIDEFLDKVSECALVMVATLHHTLESETTEVSEATHQRLGQMLELKRNSSQLRRSIEAELYTEMLIPDLLGDVASLTESLHRLVEEMHHAMRFLQYGRIEPPEFIGAEGKELATAVGHCVEELVQASRAYFRDFTHVRDFVHKVGFYESESDALRDRLLDKIYQTDLGLAEKDHLARAVRELDSVADRAERIADTLTICAIKRAE
jgi:predicted phosphate transport protein (TIGR00153 family)